MVAIGSLLASASAFGQLAQARDEIIYLLPCEDDADGMLCQHRDGRVFVTVTSTIGEFAMEGDMDAMPAFNRAFRHRPGLFRLLDAPKGPPKQLETEHGFTQELTVEDRKRLRAITMGHWRFYFADQPTTAQVDQLIDSLGPDVARKLVRAAVKKGDVA